MSWGRGLLGFATVCAVAVAWTAASDRRSETQSEGRPPARSVAYQPAAPARRTLRNPAVGFSLSFPRSWKVAGQVTATEFAAGSACQSVRVVDFQPSADSGPGAQVLQSFVQMCWKRLSGGESLAAFMDRTYGEKAAGLFERTELGGAPAYRTKGDGHDATIFLQTDAHRIQIVASVVAEPTKRALRRTQVQRILASFSATP